MMLVTFFDMNKLMFMNALGYPTRMVGQGSHLKSDKDILCLPGNLVQAFQRRYFCSGYLRGAIDKFAELLYN